MATGLRTAVLHLYLLSAKSHLINLIQSAWNNCTVVRHLLSSLLLPPPSPPSPSSSSSSSSSLTSLTYLLWRPSTGPQERVTTQIKNEKKNIKYLKHENSAVLININTAIQSGTVNALSSDAPRHVSTENGSATPPNLAAEANYWHHAVDHKTARIVCG